MRKFNFRLETVLKVRAHSEEEAKARFLEKRVEILGFESQLSGVRDERAARLTNLVDTLEGHCALETSLGVLDDRERECLTVISVLVDEEEALRLAWIEAKKEVETVVKLKQKAYAEWLAESDRAEQAALDEWAVTRRVA